MESSPKEEGFSEEGSIGKCCYDCKTTKTPLWRSGPSGPKSLCNACGIRHRKTLVSSPEGGNAKNDQKKKSFPDTENDSENRRIGKKKKKKKGMKLKNGLKVNLLGLKRITSQRQWGEVERAALLLMALSCGAVFD